MLWPGVGMEHRVVASNTDEFQCCDPSYDGIPMLWKGKGISFRDCDRDVDIRDIVVDQHDRLFPLGSWEPVKLLSEAVVEK